MKTLVLVGGYSDTIEVFQLDICDDNVSESKLTAKESCKVDEKPSFLHVEDDKIYCIHEVSSFKGERTGSLSFLKIGGCKVYRIQSQFSSGEEPCHILINPNFNCAYISNYKSGHFAVMKVKKDGMLGGGMYIESFDMGSNVIPKRQEESHPHGATFKDNHVYVADLGADKIWHYQHGSGTEFTEGSPSSFDTPPGSGPRHLAFHPTHDLVFLVTELSCEVIVYKYDKRNGNLEQLSTYKYVQDSDGGENYGSEIVVHPNGKFLYVSNRGRNGSIFLYKIVDGLGKLEKIQCFDTIGNSPRHFSIEKNGKLLLCVDEEKNQIEMSRIDETTGKLNRIQVVECRNKPSCVVLKDYVPLEDI